MEDPARIAQEDLAKARFCKGLSGTKGFMYYVTGVSQDPNWAKAIEKV